MKRPVRQLPAAVSLTSPPSALGLDATDAALLAALDAPAFLHAAQSC